MFGLAGRETGDWVRMTVMATVGLSNRISTPRQVTIDLLFFFLAYAIYNTVEE